MKTINILSSLADVEPLDNDESYVYILFNNHIECIYVGQTKNLSSRLHQHISDGKSFTRVKIDICKTVNANDIEANNIVNLQPKLNKELPFTENYIAIGGLRSKLINIINECSDIELGVVYSSRKVRWLHKENADKIINCLKITIGDLNGCKKEISK